MMRPVDPYKMSLADLRRAVSHGDIPAESAAYESLERARSVNDRLKCFVEMREGAPDEASSEGPLSGVPIALKDLFGDSGRAPTAGSKAHAEWCTETATIVTRLRTAGAAIVGYSNLHEWAIGTTSAVTALGPIANPWNMELITGGSSGGSAAALAAGLVQGAIGTDAGGSIRIPSACCGVVGLKPTWGAVPIDGYCEGEVAIDHIGPMARSVRDVRILFEVLADKTVEDVSVDGLRVGVARDHFFDDVDPRVEDAIENAIELLGKTAVSVTDVTVAGADRASGAIASLLLPHTARLLSEALTSRRDDFPPETLAFLDMGAAMSNEDIERGLAIREDLMSAWDEVFRSVDVVVTPTIGGLPPPIKDPLVSLPSGRQSPEGAFLALNAPMNAGGVPSLSLPCALVGELSVNVSLSGARGREDLVLAVGQLLEDALDGEFRNRMVEA
jgi:Asp-tRNA(Asn)/Glu-tRNA(Gln) amidotransferase A subunit family amidase